MTSKECKKITSLFFVLTLNISALLICFYNILGLSLFLGFAIGAAFSFLLFWIKEAMCYSILSTSKKAAIAKNILFYTITFILILALTVGLIYLNNFSIIRNHNIFNKYSFQIIFYPINMISYLFGLSILKISIFLSFINIKKRKEA
ncbi:hypothetical protein [Mycoplasmopsis primatum]|uniref:hypothetical protein n=1 Tax=Mycoplasmopsis primatum TaxID=55604 RepID=UPI000496499F|nr:hypothetical protein [Mycoplasmopsis primatum]